MMLWKMVVETVVLDCQDEKVLILNVLPVQKLVSFSPRTEPCSTKCEEVLMSMRTWNLNMISMLNLKLRMLIRRVMIMAIACLVREG